MSNTSYHFKESNQVMIQGGEKKVMKKILSVALSTAMAFSMFASVAFGDSANLTSQQKFDVLKEAGIVSGYKDGSAGLEKDMTRAEFAKVVANLMGLEPVKGQYSFKDKGYEKYWAAPYIEAVYAAGLMEGKNQTKKIFDYRGKVTVQEMAAVLVRALKLEVPENTNNNASNWAKGYVQAAIDANIIEASANPKANATRAQLMDTAYEIYLSQQKPKVLSYEVKDSGKVVEFKLADNELVKVELETPLKANVATEVKFKHNNFDYTESVTWVVTSATKVESASASNLKEVEVVFDGKVDKATATDKNNYVVDSNSKGIKSVSLLEDGKTVRILLNNSSKFTQGTTYKVLVKNVKGENGNVLPQGEVSFTSSDNTLPTVTEVKGLGTKVIKVTFSEPVVAPSSSNFQLDGKAYIGAVTQGANQREVILRDYTGTIAVGEHKLTTSLVEDYAGLKSLADTKDFTVAVDSEGPKVTEISATLEKVTVTFDEEIDPDTVTNDSFYWKNGDSKKTGKVTQIAANVYEIEFSPENRLPGYESTLFVEVKDYSGNANAVKEHKITASVDLVQPKVVEVSYGANRANELTVRFDKTVKIDRYDRKYFTIKKGDDVIPVKEIENVDGKTFNLKFYNDLEYGTYSIKIAGVQDTTALKNTLVEYNGTFIASDSNAPVLKGEVDANNATRKVTVNFDRDMDLATLNNPNNYYFTFTKKGSNVSEQRSLPSDVKVNAVNGGKSVTLQFPEYIDGTPVTFDENGRDGSVSSITVTGLKSRTGQNVAIRTYEFAAKDLKVKDVVQKDAKTFEVEFDHVVASASTSDFRVGGYTPSSVSVDGTKVTLKTSDEFLYGAEVVVLAKRAQTYSGNTLDSDHIVTTKDSVAPKIDKAAGSTLDQVDQTVTIPFTVELATEYKGNDNLAKEVAYDLIIKKMGVKGTPELTANVDYKTSFINNGKSILVEFLNTDYQDEYSIQIKKGASYIRAKANSDKVAAESEVFMTSRNDWKNAEFVEISSANFVTTTAGVKASATNGDFTITAKNEGVDEKEFKIVERSQNNNVVLDDDTIYVKDTTTVTYQMVMDTLEDEGFAYDVAAEDANAIVKEDTFKLAGGVDPVGNVVVKFNKDVVEVDNVTIGGKVYASDVAKLTDKNTLTINVNKDAVVNKEVFVKVKDAKGQVDTIKAIVN
ncbi:Ig-like domain-containing protein [Paenibacillus faecalis]|uniref:Ig-like domain-containing protein n=1 Tax=Paenibacillus faecalis TaxID=2079532 RepID=UPI000D0EBD06|nr:S-layer homology domain-containing protein [Paenibacillus faecalis]